MKLLLHLSSVIFRHSVKEMGQGLAYLHDFYRNVLDERA